MKKILLLAGVASLFSFDAEAIVLRPYVSVKGKMALTQNKVQVIQRDEFYNYDHDIKIDETVMGWNASIGLMLPFDYRSIRTEIEYNSNKKASKVIEAKKDAPQIDASIQTKAMFLNMYYDFQSTSAWVPYIGGGIGRAEISSPLLGDGGKKKTMAWNAGLGLQYRMSRHGSLDFGYRYVSFGSFSRYYHDSYKYMEDDKADVAAHEFYAGLRIVW